MRISQEPGGLNHLLLAEAVGGRTGLEPTGGGHAGRESYILDHYILSVKVSECKAETWPRVFGLIRPQRRDRGALCSLAYAVAVSPSRGRESNTSPHPHFPHSRNTSAPWLHSQESLFASKPHPLSPQGLSFLQAHLVTFKRCVNTVNIRRMDVLSHLA